jgi:hypothetical protein
MNSREHQQLAEKLQETGYFNMKHILEYYTWVEVNEGKSITDSYYPKAFEIIKGLVNRGFTVEQAAGWAGNMFQESDLNHKSVAPNGAFGLIQWLGDRKKAELKFEGLTDKAKSSTDFNKQLDFIKAETVGSITYPDGRADVYEKGRWNKAVSAIAKGVTSTEKKVSNTPEGWAIAIDEYSIRSGGSALETRKTAARKIYDEYTKLTKEVPAPVEAEPTSPEPIGKLPLLPITPVK